MILTLNLSSHIHEATKFINKIIKYPCFMNEFNHVAKNLQEKKKIVFTALSCKNFHQRMLICKHAFEQGVIPLNPFNLFGYYLYELVDRNLIRNANNNILKKV